MSGSKEFLYIDLHVLTWAKFNPRYDGKKASWFRVDSKIVTSTDLVDFTDGEKWAWICILAACCDQNSAKIRVNIVAAKKLWNLKFSVLKKAIEKLERNQSVKVISGLSDVGSVSKKCALQTDRQTIQTDEHYKTDTTVVRKSEPTRVECLEEFKPIESVILDRKVSKAIQGSWLGAFPEPEWVMGEIRKALAWEAADPRRKKKLFGKFITGWLTRGWDSRRVSSPARGPLRNFAQEREESNRSALDAYLKTLPKAAGGDS